MFELRHPSGLRSSPSRGVRFRIYSQPPFVPGFEEPETISLPSRPGEIRTGPSDERFYTISPASVKPPYDPPDTLPPFRGALHSPAEPDRFGHFDSISETSPTFRSAHVFAVARHTLSVWERYLGRTIPWAFHFPRMELVPEVDWANAHSGYGFIELGHSSKRSDGMLVPYWQNFDVIAHEVGHAILFSLIPLSSQSPPSREYRAIHESGSDLVALIAAMNSDRLLWHVLDRAFGDIYGCNEINRLGEISAVEQVRVACNEVRLSDVADAEKIHTYSLPLTGALFDILSLRYLRTLRRHQVMPAELLDELLASESLDESFPDLQGIFKSHYQSRRRLFFDALIEARDYLGRLLAHTFARLSSRRISFLEVANTILDVNADLFLGEDEENLAEIFLWREIGINYRKSNQNSL